MKTSERTGSVSGPEQAKKDSSTGSKGSIKNVFSIDVEDFFHGKAFRSIPRSDWPLLTGRVEANVDILLELLERYNVKSTFFFLGWIAERYPNLLRKVASCKHEIASHGHWHDSDIASPDELYRDIRAAKEMIEGILGERVLGLRLPSFVNPASREWFLDAVEAAGYLYDSSLYPPYHPWYGWNAATRRPHKVRSNLYEIPMSSIRIRNIELPMGGGGYFRLLPTRSFVKGISLLNRNNQSAVMYIHPYDIDEKSPSPKPIIKKIRRGIRMGNPLHKIGRVLGAFPFVRMIELLPQPSPSAFPEA